MNIFKLKVANLERDLPICAIDNKIDIAAFIIFGDVELTVAASKELLGLVCDFDVIITPEAKSIPIAYEMARQSGKPYVVARKSIKLYMTNPLKVSVKSITTDKEQTLYLSENDVKVLSGKRVIIVDDVISTGESITSVKRLVELAGGTVVETCSILAEGGAASRDDITFLASLPLFIKE